MTKNFRVIDTGVREGRLQIAFDDALIDLHKSGKSPDTVRFLRFPPTVLVGRHQAISHELKLDHVRKEGMGVVRRITGGGAIYLDEDRSAGRLCCLAAAYRCQRLATTHKEYAKLSPMD